MEAQGSRHPVYGIPCETREDMASAKPLFSPFLLLIPPTRWGLFLNSNFLTGWGWGEDRKPPHVRMGQEVWSEDLLKVQKTAKELEKTVTFNFFIILEIN